MINAIRRLYRWLFRPRRRPAACAEWRRLVDAGDVVLSTGTGRPHVRDAAGAWSIPRACPGCGETLVEDVPGGLAWTWTAAGEAHARAMEANVIGGGEMTAADISETIRRMVENVAAFEPAGDVVWQDQEAPPVAAGVDHRRCGLFWPTGEALDVSTRVPVYVTPDGEAPRATLRSPTEEGQRKAREEWQDQEAKATIDHWWSRVQGASSWLPDSRAFVGSLNVKATDNADGTVTLKLGDQTAERAIGDGETATVAVADRRWSIVDHRLSCPEPVSLERPTGTGRPGDGAAPVVAPSKRPSPEYGFDTAASRRRGCGHMRLRSGQAGAPTEWCDQGWMVTAPLWLPEKAPGLERCPACAPQPSAWAKLGAPLPIESLQGPAARVKWFGQGTEARVDVWRDSHGRRRMGLRLAALGDRAPAIVIEEWWGALVDEVLVAIGGSWVMERIDKQREGHALHVSAEYAEIEAAQP